MVGPALLGLALASHPLDPWDLVRVEVPHVPGALSTSRFGSLLDAPPADGTPWRPASMAEVGPVDLATLDADAPEPPPPAKAVGRYGTEAADALRVGPWHDAGHRGQGVRVAVFDPQWQGATLTAAELGAVTTHDCAADPTCRAPIDDLHIRFANERGSHGVACAETVRDLAPEAELHLVRVSSLTSFEAAVDWAIAEGVHVVSMSMAFFNESFYDGTGPVAEQARRLADADVLLVASVGNNARKLVADTFHDPAGTGLHRWAWGSTWLPLRFGEGTHTFYVTWDDFGRCGDTDFDARLVDATGAELAVAATPQPDGERCRPVERLRATLDAEAWTWLEVRHAAGDRDKRFHVLAPTATVYGAAAQGTVTDPASSPLSWAVGAVRADGYLENAPEGFSSAGPTPAGLARPALVAPDGLSTATFGPLGFYGTSASAPAAAGAVAVVLSRDVGRSPSDVARWLEGAAWQPDLPEAAMGSGLLRLPDPHGGGCAGAPLLLLLFFGAPAAARHRVAPGVRSLRSLRRLRRPAARPLRPLARPGTSQSIPPTPRPLGAPARRASAAGCRPRARHRGAGTRR